MDKTKAIFQTGQAEILRLLTSTDKVLEALQQCGYELESLSSYKFTAKNGDWYIIYDEVFGVTLKRNRQVILEFNPVPLQTANILLLLHACDAIDISRIPDCKKLIAA